MSQSRRMHVCIVRVDDAATQIIRPRRCLKRRPVDGERVQVDFEKITKSHLYLY